MLNMAKNGVDKYLILYNMLKVLKKTLWAPSTRFEHLPGFGAGIDSFGCKGFSHDNSKKK
jgi:hypothetical protein